jgi:hypothetical protein
MDDLKFVAMLAILLAIIGVVGWYLDSLDSQLAFSGAQASARIFLTMAVAATIVAVGAWFFTLRKGKPLPLS